MPRSYFSLHDPNRGTANEGRQAQVMFRQDESQTWEPITPVLDAPTAREIVERANRLPGALLTIAEMKVGSLEERLAIRERAAAYEDPN